MRLPENRPPVPPGEILMEEFLRPLGLNKRQAANLLGIPYRQLTDIIRGRRPITADDALRLAKFFGTTPDVWLNLQQRMDVYNAMRRVPIDKIPTYIEWKAAKK